MERRLSVLCLVFLLTRLGIRSGPADTGTPRERHPPRVFPLTPEQFEHVQQIFTHPETLEYMLCVDQGETKHEAKVRGHRILYAKTAEDEQKDPRFIEMITVVAPLSLPLRVSTSMRATPPPKTIDTE